MLADIDIPDDDAMLDGDAVSYQPKLDDEIGQFVQELEVRLRRYVDDVRAAERSRYEAKLQQHAERLQALAQQRLREKVASMRQRFQTAHIERERRLRERYRNLRSFANKMARQKAAIYTARRQIADKLQMVEQIHAELSQLGSQLNDQLDDLDDLMPSIGDKTGTGDA